MALFIKIHTLATLVACTNFLIPVPASGQADTMNNDSCELHWFKGNTHTHTLNSDGDSPPGEVAQWYRDNDYDFLVLSDHNYLTKIDELQHEFDRQRERDEGNSFLLIPGEEVTSYINVDERHHVIHVNGIGTERVVGRQEGSSPREIMQKSIDEVHDAGGFPHVNHPNFYWSITPDDLYSMKRLRHFEIYNGHPKVHVSGGGEQPSLEELWDDLLSRGRVYYGVAVDDAHSFQQWGRHLSNPGRGWIMVRAGELKRTAIVEAMRRGDFYASTGVELEELSTDDGALRLRIKPEVFTNPVKGQNADRYHTYFIGEGGKVLKVDESLKPSYKLKLQDLYVRARVVSSNGAIAWTQPLFAPGKSSFE